VILYAESSAVLAWLLGDDGGGAAGEALAAASGVVASDLTRLECERVLIRAWSTGLLDEAAAADHQAQLACVAAHWTRLRLSDDVLERALRPFPIEPVRALDALHLASALVARSAAPGLALLTLDQRVRENAQRLGLDVVP
jgi:predicted nucleic acid-binding protein